MKEIGIRICSTQLRPGGLFPDEETLSERYDVGRTVVREAIKILAGSIRPAVLSSCESQIEGKP